MLFENVFQLPVMVVRFRHCCDLMLFENVFQYAVNRYRRARVVI